MLHLKTALASAALPLAALAAALALRDARPQVDPRPRVHEEPGLAPTQVPPPSNTDRAVEALTDAQIQEMILERRLLRVVEHVEDAVGAYVLMGAEHTPVKVEHLIWGIKEDGALGFAVFSGVDDEGKRYFTDNTEAFARIAFTPAELSGAYIPDRDTGARRWIDSISYCVDGLGYLMPLEARGLTEGGEPLHWGVHVLLSFCCQQADVTTTDCISNCTPKCPGPTDCTCEGGNGSCTLESVTGQACRGRCGPAYGCQGADGNVCKPAGGGCDCGLP